MNDSGGIYWRSSTNWNTPIAKSGYGVYPGTYISVTCYQLGTANVPGTTNAMWVKASWYSGPGMGSGWINEHFVNDGASINKAATGVPSCSATVSPTVAETAAVNWAKGHLGQVFDTGACLAFTYHAYLDSTNTNLWNWSRYSINSNTYPEQVWDAGFTHGHTGTGTPPFGALVFYNSTGTYGVTYSHVALSVGGGNTISTSDSVSGVVHYETLTQHAAAGPYNSYVGWWLPDR